MEEDHDNIEKKLTVPNEKIKIIVFSVLVLSLIFAVVVYVSYVQKIKDLKTDFISTKLTENGPEYTWVKKKPSNWMPLDLVSKDIVHAIVISEDWAFYNHKGYDSKQIKKAFGDWLDKKKGLRGASTITQQLAKNLFLSHERSFIRKFKELILSMMLENHLTKRKILEVYLNVIEYGINIYGIKSATQHYFKKYPLMLNPREAAFMAMLLPNPKKYSQSFREKKLTPFAEKRVREILHKMEMGRYLTKMQLDWSLKNRFSWEPVPYSEDTVWDEEDVEDEREKINFIGEIEKKEVDIIVEGESKKEESKKDNEEPEEMDEFLLE